MTQKIKFVFYRPHENIWFRNTVKNIRAKYSFPNKYAIFFDYAVNSGAEVYLAPKLFYAAGFKGLVESIRDIADLVIWCILNKISLRKVGFVLTKKSLAKKNALFAMHYGNFTYDAVHIAEQGGVLARGLADIPIYKVVHMTHYAYNPVMGNRNLVELKPDLLVAENNLGSNSSFFNTYFKTFTRKVDLLPYVPMPRFVSQAPFKDRSNKLVVTGSITYKMTDKEFVGYFGGNDLQPLRRKLYEQASQYVDEMNCLVVDLNDLEVPKPARPRDSLGKRLARRMVRLFHPVQPENAQQNYYRKNIVDTYNEHRMFAVPEEICDLPAIGFVEGMACGCAYFGLDNAMYRDLGMVPGVHYVIYDGTIADLMTKVRYYQLHSMELEDIAKKGCEFVKTHLSAEAVYGAFFEQLARDLYPKVLEKPA